MALKQVLKPTKNRGMPRFFVIILNEKTKESNEYSYQRLF